MERVAWCGTSHVVWDELCGVGRAAWCGTCCVVWDVLRGVDSSVVRRMGKRK